MFKHYLRFIGKTFGEKRPHEEPDLDPYNFKSSCLLDTGISWIHFNKCHEKELFDRKMRNINDLSDFVSFFATCNDGSILLTLDSNPQEFWIPGTPIPPNSNMQNEMNKELADIFGQTTNLNKLLSISKISAIPNKSFSHYVMLLYCTSEHKKKTKNSKKYRGKLRWLHENELQQKVYTDFQKSPEILYYFNMITNKFNHKIEYYDGLPPEICIVGNFFEINENAYIGNEKSIYNDLIQSVEFTKSVQIEIFKLFILIAFPAIYMSKEQFIQVCVENGWNKTNAGQLFRSADVTNKNGLSFRDFLYILAIIEPTRANVGADVKHRYIFRYFDIDKDNFLNFDELKNLLIELKKAKKQVIDATQVNKETQTHFKHLNNPPKLSLQNFLQLIDESKIKDINILVKAEQSIKTTFLKRMSIDSNQQINKTLKPNVRQMQSMQSTHQKMVKVEGSKPIKVSLQYDIALHTILIEKSGNMINVEEVWDVEGAASSSILKDNELLENDQLIKNSKNLFDKQGICNELLRQLRYLYDANKDSYNIKKRDSYLWKDINKKIYGDNLIQICAMAEKILCSEPRLITLSAPLYVMGDLHGNFDTLINLENCFWSLGPILCPSTLLFLGDYVDRGTFSLEVVTYLLTYKVQNPKKVILIRGNHEIREIQNMFTFPTECVSKFGDKIGVDIWKAINRAFDVMPLAATIDNKIFCCHGGIPPPWLCPVVAAINAIPTNLNNPDVQSCLAWELMWNDPVRSKQLNENLSLELIANEGFAYNAKRGTAHVFNLEALEKFLATNGFSHMIRAHEVAFAGFNIHQNCKLFTVFSSSEYCGGHNEAACILVNQGKLRILRLDNSKK